MNAKKFAKKFGYQIEFDVAVACASYKDAIACLMIAKFEEVSPSIWKCGLTFVSVSSSGHVWFCE